MTINNQFVFAAAVAGAIGGNDGSRPNTNASPSTYIRSAEAAVAFGEEFDSQWGANPADDLEQQAILSACQQFLRDRNITSTVPADYTRDVAAIIAYVKEADSVAGSAGYKPTPAGGAPLTRTKFIDALTTTPESSQTGSEGAPYGSVPDFLATLKAPTSVDDAGTPVVGWVSPTPLSASGTADWHVRGHRNVQICGIGNPTNNPPDALSPVNVVWDNSAASGGSNAPTTANLVLQNVNVNVTGTMTITDDGAVPSTLVILGESNPLTQASGPVAGFGGAIDASGATNFQAIFGRDALILIPSLMAPTATLFFDNCGVLFHIPAPGGIQGIETENGTALNNCFADSVKTVSITDSTASLNTLNNVEAFFSNGSTMTGNDIQCTVGEIFNTTFNLFSGSIGAFAFGIFGLFDGPSWRSWVQNGGLNNYTGVVLVVGGFLAGSVPGTNITNPTGPTTVSLDGSGASTGFTTGGNYYQVTALTGAATVDLGSGSAQPGDTMCIAYNATGGHALTIADATSSATIATLSVQGTSAVLEFNGSNWTFLKG